MRQDKIASLKLATFTQAIGKTVARVNSNSNTLCFTDGTYLSLTNERDTSGLLLGCIVPRELTPNQLLEAGLITNSERVELYLNQLMEADDAKRVKALKQILLSIYNTQDCAIQILKGRR